MFFFLIWSRDCFCEMEISILAAILKNGTCFVLFLFFFGWFKIFLGVYRYVASFVPKFLWESKQNLSWKVYYWYSFTSIQTSKSLAKTGTLNAGTSELIPKKTLLTLHSPFCLFLKKISLTKLQSWVLWSLLLLTKPSDALQNGSF